MESVASVRNSRLGMQLLGTGKPSMRTLIVQPWFTAIGHPAQSVLNTARALGVRSNVGYLISDPGDGDFAAMASELQKHGLVERFRSLGDSLRTGTLFSLPAVLRVTRQEVGLRHVFFLDAHLVALASGWPFVARMAPSVRLVSSVYLTGPEHIASHNLARTVVSSFLSSPGRRIFLRTTELRQAWRDAFPQIPRDRIETIPSLELADDADLPSSFRDNKEIRFGVIGQVRPGKGLEWLVPLFAQDRTMGILNIAGTFTSLEHQKRLTVLSGYPNFDNRFLTEADMLTAASSQDYLLALYQDWDVRMEAATVYLAARVGRPVIVYDEGWPGRMIREFGCGLAVSRDNRPDESFFKSLPRPGDDRYQEMLHGIERFRAAHGGAGSREDFLGKMFDA
jgi:glycosyltransferase involved in cell wall biosynthesis